MSQDPKQARLTPEQEAYIAEMVKAGTIASVPTFVPQDFAQGMAECERGEATPLFDEDGRAEIARLRAVLADIRALNTREYDGGVDNHLIEELVAKGLS